MLVILKYTIIRWIDEVYIKIQDAYIKKFEHHPSTSSIEISPKTGYLKKVVWMV